MTPQPTSSIRKVDAQGTRPPTRAREVETRPFEDGGAPREQPAHSAPPRPEDDKYFDVPCTD